jgi:hypothetical protein
MVCGFPRVLNSWFLNHSYGVRFNENNDSEMAMLAAFTIVAEEDDNDDILAVELL